MALLDNISPEDKFKLEHNHKSEDLEIWCVLLDGITLKVKHWKIEEKADNSTLREIWLNEVRQLNRLRSIGESNKYLELLYKSHIDEKGYYLLYETNTETISLRNYIEEKTCDIKSSRPNFTVKLNYPWIHPLGLKKIENRIILWKNILKIVRAIKILHQQGIVHRNISLDTILVDDIQDNLDETDKFKLSGFEWSVYLNTLKKVDYSPVTNHELINSSIHHDWVSLGNVLREILISNKFDQNLIKSEINLINQLSNDNEFMISHVLSESIENYIKQIINELPQYGKNTVIAYITNNDTREHDSYKRIRNKISTYLNKEFIYEEIFQILESDLKLNKIEIRQVQFKNGYTYLLKGKEFIYQIESYKGNNSPWEIGYIVNLFDKFPAWSDASEKIEIYNKIAYIKKSEISKIKYEDIFNWNIIINQFEKEQILNEKEKGCLKGLVLNHAIDTAIFTNQKYDIKYKKINESIQNDNSSIRNEDYYYEIELVPNTYKDKISKNLSMKKQREVFYSQFETNEVNPEWIIEHTEKNGNKEYYILYYVNTSNKKLIFSSKQNISLYLNEEAQYTFYQTSLKGTDKLLERRNHALNKLIDHKILLESLTDPAQCLRFINYDYDLSNSLNNLDDSKKKIFPKLLSTNPNFVVQGPPGVGKTHLISTLVKQIFHDENSSKIILTAQSHSTVKVLYDEIIKKNNIDNLIVIDAFENDENQEEERLSQKVTQKYLEDFSKSAMYSKVMKTYPKEVKDDLTKIMSEKTSYQFYDIILRSANLIFTTTNSKTLETLIRNNINFDLSIMEESAKVSGIELISPMLVSHKRIMIGDYLQLPAFGEQIINNIQNNREQFDYKIILNELNNTNFRKDIFQKLNLIQQDEEPNIEVDSSTKNEIISNLDKYFSIFRFLSKEAEKINKRSDFSFGATITKQYRMHPHISKIVSSTIYNNTLENNEQQEEYYLNDNSNPIFFKDHCFEENINSNMAVTWIDTKDKNDNPKLISDYESNYTNITEIKIINELLKNMHINEKYSKKNNISIQILSPYKKQVKEININLRNLKLNNGIIIENGPEIARTVDSFQGDEADIIIISLVRHNSFTPYTRALGFLMDMRRMNVLLSRAKYKMFIVGCFKMFKFWSNHLEEHSEFFKKNPSELEKNNLKFLKDFVSLASDDYNLMLNSTENSNSKKYNFINFISSDFFLEPNNG
ncbi:AAA domain-containing protein [Acinetobacter baumannii]|uniref:AAA domain-containing protein n=1 Tax=Acinetobacter baumannii TaxID=470 RepID=UPI003BA91D32